jgi:hypothetical protein
MKNAGIVNGVDYSREVTLDLLKGESGRHFKPFDSNLWVCSKFCDSVIPFQINHDGIEEKAHVTFPYSSLPWKIPIVSYSINRRKRRQPLPPN